MKEETVIDKLIKHWEEKIGTKLYEDEVETIKQLAYQLIDETIKRHVTLAKEKKERFQRFKGLGLE